MVWSSGSVKEVIVTPWSFQAVSLHTREWHTAHGLKNWKFRPILRKDLTSFLKATGHFFRQPSSTRSFPWFCHWEGESRTRLAAHLCKKKHTVYDCKYGNGSRRGGAKRYWAYSRYGEIPRGLIYSHSGRMTGFVSWFAFSRQFWELWRGIRVELCMSLQTNPTDTCRWIGCSEFDYAFLRTRQVSPMDWKKQRTGKEITKVFSGLRVHLCQSAGRLGR